MENTELPIVHKGYSISYNTYGGVYEYHNMNDCDESIGYEPTIEACIDQINYITSEREHPQQPTNSVEGKREVENTDKQKAIEAAYGEYFSICNPNSNGWSVKRKGIGFEQLKKKIKLEYNQPHNAYAFRPLSLAGIETNNCWIKIDANKPEELPQTYNGNYFVYSTTSYPPYFRIDIFTGRILNTIESGKAVFSHYQPITKPQPPIF